MQHYYTKSSTNTKQHYIIIHPLSGPSLYHVIAGNSTIRWSIVLYFTVVIQVNPILPWIWYPTTLLKSSYVTYVPQAYITWLLDDNPICPYILDCTVVIRWSNTASAMSKANGLSSLGLQCRYQVELINCLPRHLGFFKYHNTCRSLPCLATLIPVTSRHLGCQVSSIMSTVIQYQVEVVSRWVTSSSVSRWPSLSLPWYPSDT